MDPPDQLLVHPHRLMYFLFEALPAGILPSVVHPALVGEMTLAVSGLLEKKEKTLLGLEIPEEEGELPLFGVSFRPWCS